MSVQKLKVSLPENLSYRENRDTPVGQHRKVVCYGRVKDDGGLAVNKIFVIFLCSIFCPE